MNCKWNLNGKIQMNLFIHQCKVMNQANGENRVAQTLTSAYFTSFVLYKPVVQTPITQFMNVFNSLIITTKITLEAI